MSNHDMLAAINEPAVNRLFREARERFSYTLNVNESSGAFRIYGTIKFDVPRGDILFTPGNADFVRLDEIDIRTDINLTMRITTPEIAIPRVCVSIPCNGEVCTPKIVLVPSKNIYIPLDLPPITSEVSGDGMIVPIYDNLSEQWLLKLQFNPLTGDIDLIDIADTLGDLFESIARNLLNSLLGPVGDIIYTIIGEPIEWLIRTVLDITDDLSEWFMRFLSDMLGLHSIFADFLESLTGEIVIAEFDRYMEILKDKYSPNIQMTVEISDVELDITEDHELTVGVTIEP